MIAAAGPEGLLGRSAVVQFLDWYDLGEEVFLVMERPVPSVDLFYHLEDSGGDLDEHSAKVLKLFECVRPLLSRVRLLHHFDSNPN